MPHRLLLAVLLLFVSGCTTSSMMAGPTLPDARVEVTQGADGLTIGLLGVVTDRATAQIEAALATTPTAAPLTLILNSPGGYTASGYDLLNRLAAERQQGRSITTIVLPGGACESMCALIFMAGGRRLAAPDALFMVHGPRSLSDGSRSTASARRMLQTLENLGASPSWLRMPAVVAAFTDGPDYRATAALLSADGAGMVTELIADPSVRLADSPPVRQD